MGHRCCGYKGGGKLPRDVSLYDEANCGSKLSLSFMRPLVHDSLKDKSFGIKNLCQVERKARSHDLYAALRVKRDKDMASNLSLFRTFFSFIPRSYWSGCIPWAIYLAVVYSQSLLLGAYLDHFDLLREDPTYDRDWWGWLMVVFYALIGIGEALLSQLNYVWSIHIAVRARVAVTTLLYNKLIKLRESAKHVLSAGNLVNLMFTDTSRISNLFQYIIVMIFLPVEVVVAVGLIARKLGVLVLLPLGLLLVMLSFSMGMGRLMMKSRIKIMMIADGRVRKTAEILGGIRVIKLFGNEEVFYKRIVTARKYEFRNLRHYSISSQSMTALVDIIVPIVCLATFALMKTSGMEINSSVVYEVSSLINTMRYPFIFIPISVTTIQDFIVAIRRISALLSLPEKVDGECVFLDSEGNCFEDWERNVLSVNNNNKKEKTRKSNKEDDIEVYVSRSEPKQEQTTSSSQTNSSYSRNPEGQEYEFVINIPNPTTFSWANNTDLIVPPIIDENYKKKIQEEHKSIKKKMIEIKRLCKDKNIKVSQAWRNYVNLVPREYLSEKVQKKKETKSPYSINETDSFLEWISKGMPTKQKDIPLPRALLAYYPVLINMTFQVKKGETVGVCGRVGTGKSSFLNALLGELRVCSRNDKFQPPDELKVDLVRGKDIGIIDPVPNTPVLTVYGRMAYCAQSAWIMNASVRDNITFGQPFDRDWYEQVVEACCLLSDFDQFVAGDMTEIGEKGATLSGGQKHRIALARAVYSKADIYLLDDPLSAVDAHVGKRLFEDVILGLLKDKTVILATHQLQFLPRCDRSICVSNHHIVHDGPFNEKLLRSALGDDYKRAVAQYKALLEDQTPTVTPFPGRSVVQSREVSSDDRTNKKRNKKLKNGVVKIHENKSESSKESASNKEKDNIDKDAEDEAKREKGRLVEDETKSIGGIKMKKVGQYFKSAGSIAYIILVIIDLCLVLGFAVAADTMQAEWSSSPATEEGERNFMIFAIMQVLYVLTFFVAAYSLILIFLQASKNIHFGVVKSVLKAPMSFFDSTPSGRILNRFSKDTDNTDVLVPMYFNQFVVLFVFIIEMIVVIGMTNPYVLIAVAVMYIIYVIIFIRFRATPRELRRMDNITRSPVLALTTETLSGASTIRAYNKQEMFSNMYFERLDKNTTANMYYMLSMRWLSFRFDLVGIIPIIVMTALGITMYENDRIAVMIGAGLTFTYIIPMLTREMVTNFIYAESEFSSVERLLEYRDKLPSERPRHIEKDPETGADLIPKGWPSKGDIVFDHVKMRYRPSLPLVLKDVSFRIESGEKIGIVGRTGAGKTSITASLFQLYNCEEGSHIYLDGVDLTKLGIHDVRKNIAIIPQDAFLCSGTLRENLDVANLLINEEAASYGKRFTKADPEKRQMIIDKIISQNGLEGKLIPEEAMWDALDKCRLKEAFMARPGGIDFVLSDNGANLSAGERQLVCLAKALLLGCHVIIMDEATAQVDQDSDNNVQRVIRDSFKDRTILCIAHRLQTIIDFDRILVMDDGHIAEFDTPQKLLSTPGSIFSSLVDETGPESSAFLRSIALGEKTIFDRRLEEIESVPDSSIDSEIVDEVIDISSSHQEISSSKTMSTTTTSTSSESSSQNNTSSSSSSS